MNNKHIFKNDNLKINDIIVTNIFNTGCTSGEFGYSEDYGKNNVKDIKGKSVLISENETETDLINRILLHIEKLINYANDCHKDQYDNSNITRLLTNEFYFYTKTPLSLDNFKKLLQNIKGLASKCEENLHLVLGSFAVLTPDNKLMNVVPFVMCGKDPEVKLTVKNYTSEIDPVYKIKNTSGKIQAIESADILNYKKKLQKCNDDEFQFEFNNVFKSKYNNDEFYTGIDICLDHAYGVAQNNMNKLKKEDNTAKNKSVSHVVISNSIEIEENKLINNIQKPTHVDPRVKKPSNDFFYNNAFGTHSSIHNPYKPLQLSPDKSIIDKKIITLKKILLNYKKCYNEFHKNKSKGIDKILKLLAMPIPTDPNKRKKLFNNIKNICYERIDSFFCNHKDFYKQIYLYSKLTFKDENDYMTATINTKQSVSVMMEQMAQSKENLSIKYKKKIK